LKQKRSTIELGVTKGCDASPNDMARDNDNIASPVAGFSVT
jgi:hypothetical protein